ncbi:MAG: C45 family autoproteolytic acyltransferase/hydrolase [Chloroflexi bacterium]|nr:C45 family autoproteolytic acyltransferase/hydrolase [Chloroflexota bacterium]
MQFPFAEFAGTAYDLGLQHGQRFRDLVRLQLAETMQGAADSGLTAVAALEWTRRQQPAVEAIGPHWIDELQGLAQGAGIRFDEALALQLRPGTGGLPEGCTSFAAVGSATTDGHTICGQNRDLGEPYLHRMFLAAFRPTRGPHILMHCVPGEIGGVGLNSRGVCVFANSLWGKSGRTWMAPPILRRAALESETAQAAVQRIQAMHGPAVGNFLIADTRHARNLEILAEDLHVTPIDDGVYAHANNCTSSILLPHEAERRPLPYSEGRRVSLQTGLEVHAGSIDTNVCRRLLSDESGRPEPVCRPFRSGDPFATIAALIAVPRTQTLQLSHGPPSTNHFTTCRL